MRIYDNGIYRDATEQEIAEMQAMAEQEQEGLPSAEERLEALENAMLEMMLGGME